MKVLRFKLKTFSTQHFHSQNSSLYELKTHYLKLKVFLKVFARHGLVNY